MTQEIVIQLRITVPDGASYRVISAPEPDSVLSEPIPTEPPPLPEFPTAEEYANRPLDSARRGIAVQQPPSQQWVPGLVHATGHKPLKAGTKGGVFCPTKLEDGSWCQFRA